MDFLVSPSKPSRIGNFNSEFSTPSDTNRMTFVVAYSLDPGRNLSGVGTALSASPLADSRINRVAIPQEAASSIGGAPTTIGLDTFARSLQ